jgi:hypothetical protein
MADTSTTSLQVRDRLVEALRLDLVGPTNDHACARELLPESPRRWYLTGYLVPTSLPSDAKKADESEEDDVDSPAAPASADDGGDADKAVAKKGVLPSSLGLSVLVSQDVASLTATVEWGDYVYEGPEGTETTDGSCAEASEGAAIIGRAARSLRGYRRLPKTSQVTIPLAEPAPRIPLPGSDGLEIVTTVRVIPEAALGATKLPKGTRSVAVFVVNNRQPDTEKAYTRFAFQPRLRLESSLPFVPRPDLRGEDGSESSDEVDERIADVQYRDVVDYAVGHGVSAKWTLGDGHDCRAVESTWIPTAEVERVEPRQLDGVTLDMEALAALPDGPSLEAALKPLVAQYRDWIGGQRGTGGALAGRRRETTNEMLQIAGLAADRIEAGIAQLVSDPQAFDAFRIANRAMAAAGRRRAWIAGRREKTPADMKPPAWRPFQLAFILLTLRGIADETNDDRQRVDLLFFPTGGGKTEAYLGLAAFTIVLRRLKHGTPAGCGLAVLMRYTLRLLTLDQLGRATALMCALELERLSDRAKLGEWPFEIGLWVGQAATPNRMGCRGDKLPGSDDTAYVKTTRFHRDDRKNPAPIPIEECPWCGTKFTKDSFRLVPNDRTPSNLVVTCSNYACDFTRDRPLPVLGVDEPIYRRLPAFLIATVDKFAALPWTGHTGTLFGLVDRYDAEGFYGPCDPTRGAPLGTATLPAPDLIIQDELHLISGPLGTVAGLYESAIDALASRPRNGQTIKPKIIASTATVRRADTQIRALFERNETLVFPPPGPDRRDSFFAVTKSSSEVPARLYVGIAAQGRSLKVVLLRSMLAIAAAAQASWERAGGTKNPANPADPYMTMLGYFNSLRELGGSRRIVEDEVCTRVLEYGKRRRHEPVEDIFASRRLQHEVLELTSRVSTSDVSIAKSRLSKPFADADHVDVALATNMISVGLDIVRLGLMLVLGQPKTASEYIQATSRVGRDSARPGLVITLLNIHRPRDRSHYERFGTYHASFYRAVEATSVTPFSPRSLDRALVGVLVALVRHYHPTLTPPHGAELIASFRQRLDEISNRLADRARNHAWPPGPDAGQQLHDHVLHLCTSLLDDWVNIVRNLQQTSTRLEYQREAGGGAKLLFDFLDPELADVDSVRGRFRANRSMRDVEPTVTLYVKQLDEWKDR